MKLANELNQLKYEFGVLKKVYCTDEENEIYRKLLKENQTLPDGVVREDPEGSIEWEHFYTIKESSLSNAELSEYLQYKQLKSIITIKNCVIFFTVLAAISLISGLIF